MKPLPLSVQQAFSCAPGRLPERPWWYRKYADIEPRYARVVAADYILTAEEVEAYDAKHPIPHPGYRAGQVWANEHGHSVAILAAALGIVATSTREWDKGEFARFYPYLLADPSCPHLAPWSPCEVKP